MVDAPVRLRLALCVRCDKVRQAKAAILDRLVGVLNQGRLGRVTFDTGQDLVRERLTQLAFKRSRDHAQIIDGLALYPERPVQRVKCRGELRRVRPLDVAQRALGVDRRLWERRGRVGRNGHIEVGSPADALLADPLVLVCLTISVSGGVALHENSFSASLLLTVIGGRLPVVFIIPPRRTGTYVISHCAKVDEVCQEFGSQLSATSDIVRRELMRGI